MTNENGTVPTSDDESTETIDDDLSSSSDGQSKAVVDPAVPLEDDETIQWVGRPRTTVILPSVAIGFVLLAVGVGAAVEFGAMLALALVPVALAIPGGHYLVVANIQYVVTDRAIYAKRGVLGRSVTQANLETVQNSSYSQDVTGSIFGYGTVEFEIAGGDDLAFRDIHEPRPVRAYVDRASRERDGLTGGGRTGSRIPGSLEQWQAVRSEVRSIRRVLQGND